MQKKNTCKNCNSLNINNFCSDCGQPVFKTRFTIKYFFKSLLSAFDLEKGFLYTAKMLFIQPGKVTNDYINGRTKPYFNPLKYLLVVGGIYAFLILWLGIFDAGLETVSGIYAHGPAQENSEKLLRLQEKWLHFYRQIINFIPLLMIPFISIATKRFYKSRGLLYGEHLIINSYIFVQTFLILIFLTPLVIVFPAMIHYFPFITVIIIIGYFSYALSGTFRESFIRSVLGSFFSLFTGYLLFILLFMFIIISVIVITIITNQ